MKPQARIPGLLPPSERLPVSHLSTSSVGMVNRYGRNQETLLILIYCLKRNPLALLRVLPLAWMLFRVGRVSVWPRKIRGVAAVRQILSASRALELPREKEKLDYEAGMLGYVAVEKART